MPLTDNELEAERIRYFRQFQIQRLQQTYQDFMEQARYEKACTFFFGDIYSVEDTEVRDQAFEAFTHKIRKVIGGDIERCLKSMVALQHHTLALDNLLLNQLISQGAAVGFSMDEYREAYLRCDNFRERLNQIQELVETLSLSHRVLRRFGIGPGLLAMHRFQEMRGEGLATGILVRGYRALSPLKTIRPLTESIESREMAFLHSIYREHP